MIVVDASAAISGLLNAGQARDELGREVVQVPHLIDAEVASGLRRQVARGVLTASAGSSALDVWRQLAVLRHPMSALLPRVWELRENASAYDACYLALAEALGCGLLTADRRLARAPGSRCPIIVVPR